MHFNFPGVSVGFPGTTASTGAVSVSLPGVSITGDVPVEASYTVNGCNMNCPPPQVSCQANFQPAPSPCMPPQQPCMPPQQPCYQQPAMPPMQMQMGPSDPRIDDICTRLSNCSFASDAMKELKRWIQTSQPQMYVAAATRIIKCFTFASDKLKALKELVPFIIDRKQNYFQVQEAFDFGSDKNKASDLLLNA